MLTKAWLDLRAVHATQSKLWMGALDTGSLSAYEALASRFEELCRFSFRSSKQPCLFKEEISWLVTRDTALAVATLAQLDSSPRQQAFFAIFAGDRLYIDGDVNAACEIWQQYLPQSMLIWRAAFAANNEEDSCVSMILAGLDQSPDGLSLFERQSLVQATGYLAMASLVKSGLSESEFYWRWSIRLFPEHPTYHHGLGNALAGQNRTVEALEAINTAIRLEPTAPLRYVDLAKVLLQAGRLNEANEALGTAIRLDPTCAPAHDLLSSIEKTTASDE